jgi:uncharacterized cofD-like protein
MQDQLEKAHDPYFLIFDEIARVFDFGTDFVDDCYRAYQDAPVGEIDLFPKVQETLAWLRANQYRVFLVTTGTRKRQLEKMEKLGLAPAQFQAVRVAGPRLPQLEQHFRTLLSLPPRPHLEAREILCVGDRLREEIAVAKEMGMLTAQVVQGRYCRVLPRVPAEQPDYAIDGVAQLPTLLRLRENGHRPKDFRVVAIGGGTGLPIVVKGMRAYTQQLTAIVAVTDTGGHSGELLKLLGTGFLPPGDIRNVLVALAGPEPIQERLARLFDHRFTFGLPLEAQLEGANVGNLVITALFRVCEGPFKQAVQDASEILKITGKVLPVTEAEVNICAELADGTLLRNESEILERRRLTDSGILEQLSPARIQRVYLEPRPENKRKIKADPEALDAIDRADLIVLGPGALYTSVITNLLVPGIAEAIRESKAKKIYVCNIVTQPCQTEWYTAADHVQEVLRYLSREGRLIANFAALVNLPPAQAPPDTERLMEEENKRWVKVEDQELNRLLQLSWTKADLVDVRQPREGEKAGLLRHDPHKVADTICREFCRMDVEGKPV